MERRVAQLMPAAVLAAALAVTAAAHGAAPSGAAAARVALRALSATAAGATSTVVIEATEPVAYVTSRPDPRTLLVDLRHVAVDGDLAREVTAVSPIAGVSVEPATSGDGVPLARVRVSLDGPAVPRVRASRNLIVVEVDRSTAATVRAPVVVPAPPAATTTAGRTARGATMLRDVRAESQDGQTAVALVGNGRLVASSVEVARDLPPRVLLDFHGVTGGQVPPVTAVNRDGVRRVRVGLNSRTPLVTRVVIDLDRHMPYRVEEGGQDGEELRVLFGEAPAAPVADTAAPAAPAPLPEEAPAPAPSVQGPAETAPIVLPDPPAVEVIYERAPPPAMPAVVPAVAPAPAPPPAATAMRTTALAAAQPAEPVPPRFTGHPITLDFQGADLRAVLRTFAEISGLNVVIDPAISGQVDVALRDVPWDQALDIILKANKLGYAVDGTVVRIAPLTVLADEEAQRRKLAEATALAGELEVLTRSLSYAKASEMTSILTQSALSSRGQVQVDARTNTLIVRDLPERLAAAADLITALDRPQPQVEIEARIVQTSRDFARALGIEWGGSATASPRYGNTLPLAFPNSATVDGGVNLAAPAPSSAIGLSLGSVNGAVNLDVALTALEAAGNGRILSTPRVSTQNNVQAEITQGTQIPIQTIANNTVTVSFKDAALTLRVTPQITVANTVIMRIELENATPDFSRAVNGIPPIDTQRALTSVLVGDGETTVIGGIYVSRESTTTRRTPLVSRIPLLGWLFKADSTLDESSELLIFITPRITLN
jgi:type IV pilus secretin PilQ/predicted competence protein